MTAPGGPARRRAGPPALALAAAVWTCVVLVGAFPDVARHALRLVGHDPPARDEALGPVMWPSDLDLSRIAEDLWAVLGAVVLVAIAHELGRTLMALGRIARPGTRGESLVAIALGLTTIAIVMALLGLVHLLTHAAVVVLMVVLGAHAARGLARRRAALRAVRARLGAAVAGIGGPGVVTALAVALFGLIALAGALAPEVEFDAVWFHLWLPDEYLREGFLEDQPQEYVALYPQNMELLFGWGLVWGGVLAAKLVAYAVAGLTAAATWSLARRFVSRRGALIAVLIVVSSPLVLWEAATTYVDLPLAFLATVMTGELIEWRRERDRAHLWRAALLLGAALDIKHLALLFIPLVVAVILVTPAPPGRDGLVARAGRAAAFCGIALALPALWYARAVALAGNPVFPELYGVFGAPTERWNALSEAGLARFLEHFGPERTPAGLLGLPWTLVSQPDRFDGSVGPILLIALPLLALSAARHRPGLGVAAFLAGGFVALWASPLSSFQARFLVTVIPLLAVLAAVGLEALTDTLAGAGLRRTAVAVPLAVVVIVLANVPPLAPWHGRVVLSGPGYAQGYVNHTTREIDLAAVVDGGAARSYVDRRVPGARAIRWANRNLPPEGRLMTEVSGVHLYSRRDLLVSYATMADTVLRADRGTPRLRDSLADLGVTAVLVDRRGDLEELLRESIPGSLNLRYGDDEARIYTLS